MTAVALVLATVGSILAMVWGNRNRKHRDELASKLLANEERVRHQAEMLEVYHSRDQQLVQNAGEALFVFDQKDGALLEINHQAENLLGYTQREVIPLTFRVLFSREHRQRLLRMTSTVIKQGEAEVDQIKFRRKDGRQFIGSVRVRTGQLNEKKVIYGSFRDVTQTTNLQAELQRHNRHLSLLNEISHRVAEGHDLSQTLEIILDEVIKSFAISGGGIFLLEQSGTEMKLALHRNIPGDVIEELGGIKPGIGLAGKVVETGRPRLSTNLQKDHRRISNAVFADGWRAFLAVPFIAEDKTLGVLFIFDRGMRVFSREDVRLTQAIGRQLGPLLKNAELLDELQWQHRLNSASLSELERSRSALRDNLEQLEKHHRALKSLNQMKSSFLSLASHELRTPLTTILSGAEFLRSETEEVLGENEKRALDVILRGSRRLNHIVDDLIEAARLEANTLYIAHEAFNPLLMINDLLAKSTPSCVRRNLHLELQEFPDDTTIRGDSHHLQRAFNRLMENAIKFTPEDGWIRIAGQSLEREEVFAQKDRLCKFSESFFDGGLAEHYLQISISDTGIGIEETDQIRIFDKFQEVGEISGHSTSRSSFGGKGIGLGLTLAKGIFETHGGMIWVGSAGPSQGSCFSVLLPQASEDE